jgi:hypothetical protein
MTSLSASAAFGAAALCFLATPAASFNSPIAVSEATYMHEIVYADDSCNGEPGFAQSIVTNQCISRFGLPKIHSMVIVCDDVAKSCKMSQYLDATCQGAVNDTKTAVADGSCQALQAVQATDALLLMAGQPSHLSKPRAGAACGMKITITTDAMAGIASPAMLVYGFTDCAGEPSMIASLGGCHDMSSHGGQGGNAMICNATGIYSCTYSDAACNTETACYPMPAPYIQDKCDSGSAPGQPGASRRYSCGNKKY